MVSIERSSVNWRGPVCGLRPECSASIWYIGLPVTPAATACGDGGGAATAADADGTGTGDAAGLTAGEAPAAGWTVGGETEATGAIASLAVGGVVALAAGAPGAAGPCGPD